MKLLEALSNASEEDYKEIEQAISEKERELESLRTARKILSKKLGKVEPSRKTVNRTRNESRDELRKAMHDFINENGETSIKKLCDVLKATPKQIASFVRESNWFIRDGEMISNA